ncbi:MULTISPECIES: hypothetical protein [unclassified Psychrobacter]|uniref:hypothetical protein n=1 Tax=unclassified Psychrobacter TaxID=196806 RepID=UPI000714C943|nr:hypothetical protein [Psychrobacter sp. P11F6]KRG34213.1 hypothetical protein AK822_04695 [Psychrobacter sp. P11F6]
MSILAKKLEEEIKQKKAGFLLVSETLELISKATDSPIDDVKKYLLSNNIDIETPVYHYQGGRSFEVLETSRPDGYFTGTRKALKEPLEGNEYFLVDDLKKFKLLSEYDVFAYERGYYYIAKKSVGRFKAGEKVIGLTEERAEFLLSKGAIEKLYIKDIEAKQSRQVQELTKQVDCLQKQLKVEREIKTEKPLIELGQYQKLLIKYQLFTAHQIACLLADYSPVGEDYNNHDYKLYKEITDTAIDARSLTIFNDKGQISSEQVKVWLARLDFIYEGFNDDVFECLNNEGDSLKRSSDELVRPVAFNSDKCNKKDEEINQLAKDYKDLRLKYEKLKAQNEEIVAELTQVKPLTRSIKVVNDNNQLEGSVQKNYLVTIGLLLELLTTSNTDDFKYGVGVELKKSLFSSQNKIIESIEAYSIYGQKRTKLAERFAEANEELARCINDLDIELQKELQECFDSANEALSEAKKKK